MPEPEPKKAGFRMQAYFDSSDAELELESLVTRSHSRSDVHVSDQDRVSPRRQLVDVIGFAIALGLAVVLIAAHLGSAMPARLNPVAKNRITETRFVIEIPPKEKPRPKPKPMVEPPKPKVVERLRSIPDSRLTETRPIVKPQERKADVDDNRNAAEESMDKRALPAVNTPVIANHLDAIDREEASEILRYAHVSDFADTVGGFVNAAPESGARSLPQETASRVKLDPYHYRMVSLCLRLCVKSMFTYSGMSSSEREFSAGWLKVERGKGEYFSCLFDGRWVRFEVKSACIGDISNLDFVDIPHSMFSGDQVNLLLEDVTRRLCRLLGYDHCFEEL